MWRARAAIVDHASWHAASTSARALMAPVTFGMRRLFAVRPRRRSTPPRPPAAARAPKRGAAPSDSSTASGSHVRWPQAWPRRQWKSPCGGLWHVLWCHVCDCREPAVRSDALASMLASMASKRCTAVHVQTASTGDSPRSHSTHGAPSTSLIPSKRTLEVRTIKHRRSLVPSKCSPW